LVSLQFACHSKALWRRELERENGGPFDLPLYVKNGKAVLHMHVPKTAGTALRAFFLSNGFREELFDGGGPQSLNHLRRCPPQHLDAAQIMALFRPSQMDFVFMTVREPMSRLVSEYRRQVRENTDVPALPAWFVRTAREFVEDNYAAANHIRPQSDFWLANCHIFRIEEGLGEDLVSLMEQRTGLSLANRNFGSHNADSGTPVDPADIERIRPLVEDFYRQDYLRFGYATARRG
jgi:hypothetical protein